MTREEARKAAEVMLAYANGEEIETLFLDKYVPCKYPFFNWADYRSPKAYRIKQKATYRLFKDKDECWVEMQKHQPFEWAMVREAFRQVLTIGNYYVCFNDITLDYNEAFDEVKFADGTPFGIKEE